MILDHTSALPGMSGISSDDGLSFFEDEVGEIFNDVGDIWGNDGGLEWDLELDAGLFSDPSVAEGLPVNRPEQPQPSGMTMPDLARAVREEHDRLRASRELEKKTKVVTPEPVKEQAIWSFDGFSQSNVEPPKRHAVKRQKDVGLLDILNMKPADPAPAAREPSAGYSAPLFPDFGDVPAKPAPKKKRPSAPRKKKKVSEDAVPLGSMTGSFLDLLPPRKKGEDKTLEDASVGSAKTEPQDLVEIPQDPRPLADTVSSNDHVPSVDDVSSSDESLDARGDDVDLNTGGDETVGVPPSSQDEEEEHGDIGPEESLSAPLTPPVHDEETDVESLTGQEGVSDQPSVEDAAGEEVVSDSLHQEEPVAEVVAAPAPENTLAKKADMPVEAVVKAPVVEDRPFGEAPSRLMTLEEEREMIAALGERPVAPHKVLPPRKPGPPETPTNRRPPRIDPSAEEIEIDDDLDDWMSHFSSTDWDDA